MKVSLSEKEVYDFIAEERNITIDLSNIKGCEDIIVECLSNFDYMAQTGELTIVVELQCTLSHKEVEMMSYRIMRDNNFDHNILKKLSCYNDLIKKYDLNDSDLEEDSGKMNNPAHYLSKYVAGESKVEFACTLEMYYYESDIPEQYLQGENIIISDITISNMSDTLLELGYLDDIESYLNTQIAFRTHYRQEQMTPQIIVQ